ncbi:glycosyltransferase family 2 protein, partial [Amycolatopsis sp. NPDC059020]
MPGKAVATGQAPSVDVKVAGETTFTEHTPQGRLTAQRGLYAGPAPIVSKDLYAELEWGSAVRDRGGVTVE